MDVEPFRGETRGSITNLITKELKDLDLTKVQTTTWIRFKVEVEDGDENLIRADMVDKAFNSQMMEMFKGSDLNEIIEEMFPQMRMEIKNPALVNSRFVFD